MEPLLSHGEQALELEVQVNTALSLKMLIIVKIEQSFLDYNQWNVTKSFNIHPVFELIFCSLRFIFSWALRFLWKISVRRQNVNY
jgi:hypothetical protein